MTAKAGRIRTVISVYPKTVKTRSQHSQECKNPCRHFMHRDLDPLVPK